MLDDELQAQSYGYFQQEAPELLQTLEHELLTLNHTWSVNKAHILMRTTHTLKGAAASVGLEGVKGIAHRLEDLFRGLCQPDIEPDNELESMLFEGFECLRQPLSAQLSGSPVDTESYLERVETILSQVQAKLGDQFHEDAGIPNSAELGFDLTLSIFQSGVPQRLTELEVAIAQAAPNLPELIATHAEVFQGLAESLGLPGFGAIATTAIAALEAHPDQSTAIAALALSDWQTGHQAVLAGDRERGGEPSAALVELSGGAALSNDASIESPLEGPPADFWGDLGSDSAPDFWDSGANVDADDFWGGIPDPTATEPIATEPTQDLAPENSSDFWADLDAVTGASQDVVPPAPEEDTQSAPDDDDFWSQLDALASQAAQEAESEPDADFWGSLDAAPPAAAEAAVPEAAAIPDDFWATLPEAAADTNLDDAAPVATDFWDSFPEAAELAPDFATHEIPDAIATPETTPDPDTASELDTSDDVELSFEDDFWSSLDEDAEAIVDDFAPALETAPIDTPELEPELLVSDDPVVANLPTEEPIVPISDSFWDDLDSDAETNLDTADLDPAAALLPSADFWGSLTPPPEPAEPKPLVLDNLWAELDESPKSETPPQVDLLQAPSPPLAQPQPPEAAKPSAPAIAPVPVQAPAPAKPPTPVTTPVAAAPVPAKPTPPTQVATPAAPVSPPTPIAAPVKPPEQVTPPVAPAVAPAPAKPSPPVIPPAPVVVPAAVKPPISPKPAPSTPSPASPAAPVVAKATPPAPPAAPLPPVITPAYPQQLAPPALISQRPQPPASESVSPPEIPSSVSEPIPLSGTATNSGLGSTVAAIAALKAQVTAQLPTEAIATPAAPPPKAPQPPAATVRININHLESLGTSLAELLTNQNRQSLQDEQLQNAVVMLHYRLQQHKALLVQLREWSDQQLIRPNVPMSGGLEWQRQFDSLELDHFSDLQVLAQTIFEDTVQLEEATDAVDLFARQLGITGDKQQRLLGTTRDVLMEARLLPLQEVLGRFERVLQQLETRHEKSAKLNVKGGDVMIDKTVAEKLYDPLLHLVRNAFDHGLEATSDRAKLQKPTTGQITIRAHHRGTNLFIDISDDGRGLDYERIRQKAISQKRVNAQQAQALDNDALTQFLFEPGFSTAATVSDLSGRGVGLDVVKTQLEALQGDVTIQSTPGQGTTFRLQIPLNLTIAQLLLCEVGSTPYALIADQVEHILTPRPEQVLQRGGDRLLRWGSAGNETLVPLRPLNHLLDYRAIQPSPPTASHQRAIILVRLGSNLMGLEVDHVLREQELVVRPFAALVRPPDYVAGGSILADGRLTLVIDSISLLSTMVMQGASPIDPSNQPPLLSPTTATVLVVEDSVTVRQTLAASLQRAGYTVIQARDGQEAADLLSQPNSLIRLIVSDVEMPRMNGFELLNFRQRQPQLQSIPMMMLTSRSSTKHQQLALGLGANAYLTKPYLEQNLLSQVSELLTLSRA